MSVPGTLRVPDAEYWREMVSCQNACPVNTDARGYVRAIADGDFERAYLIARGPNPLASICGFVCGAPCETACRRGAIDKPIAIRALKRFVCERFGPEAGHEGGLVAFLEEAAGRAKAAECSGKEELLPLLRSLSTGAVPSAGGRSVGIVGSGPAGLAAAHDLALFGCDVTIYEMEPVLAGMLATGIPEYRLQRDLVAAEVDAILALGVKAVTGCQVGVDVSFAELRARHEALLVAVGAKRSRSLPLPGGDAPEVLGGVEFLRDVSLGVPTPVGERIVVIGGGNVAYDVGRTVLRHITMDAARSARRLEGVRDVQIVALESLEEMPADDVEILEGDEEGVRRLHSLGPKEILLDDQGSVRGVRFVRCTRVFDEERRFAPLFDEDDVHELACDTVLLAVGQSFDLSFLEDGADGLERTPNGAIRCGQDGRTSLADVYVAGDLATGPKLLIHAVASGKEVARSIYSDLTGNALESHQTELHFPLADYRREDGYEKLPRTELPTADAAARLRSLSVPVEESLSEEAARCEASRCLNCGVNTIFDGQACILCGGCADVCPVRCLALVPAADVLGDDPGLSGLLNGAAAEETSVILKDETACIRCSLCAERCPAGAITMEQFTFTETLGCRAD